MRPSAREIIIPKTRTGQDFDPMSVAAANLLGWYRGDRLSKDGNSRVFIWFNLGLLGPSHDLVQTDPTKQPLYVDEVLNGWPVVRGNGSSEFLGMANAAFLQNKAAGTVIVVAKRADASLVTNTFPLIMTQGDSNTVQRIRMSIMGTNRFYMDATRADADGGGTSTYQMLQQNDYYAFYKNRFNVMMSELGFSDQTGANYTNGWQSAIKTTGFMTFGATSSNTASQVFNVFYDPKDNLYFQGDIAEVLVYDKKLSASEKALVLNGLGVKYNLPCWDTCTNYLIYEGSSTINGTNSSSVYEDRIPQRVWSTLGFPRNHLWHNDGTSNKLTSDMLVDAESRTANLPVGIAGPLNTLPLPPNVTRDKAILIVQPASNDLANGDSAATAYTATKGLLASYYNAGYRRIAIIPPQPRSDSTITGRILSYGALLRTNLQADLLSESSIPSGTIKVIDIQLLSAFDADGDYNNTTYYNADKVHLSAVVGNQLFADTIVSSLQSFGWLS